VVPTSLVANWKNEVKKFTPNLNLLSLYGGVERFEALQYYALKASNKLAKEKGRCPLFNETQYGA
jgi:SNF2 family DNA or RNA helicase